MVRPGTLLAVLGLSSLLLALCLHATGYRAAYVEAFNNSRIEFMVNGSTVCFHLVGWNGPGDTSITVAIGEKSVTAPSTTLCIPKSMLEGRGRVVAVARAAPPPTVRALGLLGVLEKKLVVEVESG